MSALTYSWTQLSGPSAGILHANTATPTVQFTQQGTFTFQLAVTDSAGSTSMDTVTILYQ